MSNLIVELVLRLLKAGLAALIGLAVYLVLTLGVGEPGSATLALLCWLAGAAFIHLVESSPL
ncbi:MAG TPA: hypothetical protein VFK38_02540 [Candidatus Limnocylindrales bacterium]|nr:hypothetical protein [Candidatus Limnocylindrales bacterium]